MVEAQNTVGPGSKLIAAACVADAAKDVNEQLEQCEAVLDGRIVRPRSGCSSILDVVDSRQSCKAY